MGFPGLLGEDVGSSIGRMRGGAMALGSLRPGLCPVYTVGGLRRWGFHLQQTGQDNELNARPVSEDLCQAWM